MHGMSGPGQPAPGLGSSSLGISIAIYSNVLVNSGNQDPPFTLCSSTEYIIVVLAGPVA